MMMMMMMMTCWRVLCCHTQYQITNINTNTKGQDTHTDTKNVCLFHTWEIVETLQSGVLASSCKHHTRTHCISYTSLSETPHYIVSTLVAGTHLHSLHQQTHCISNTLVAPIPQQPQSMAVHAVEHRACCIVSMMTPCLFRMIKRYFKNTTQREISISISCRIDLVYILIPFLHCRYR